MAYALHLSEEEHSIIVAAMNCVDPKPFPLAQRVTFYRLLEQLTRSYQRKSPTGFQLLVQFGGVAPLDVVQARRKLAEIEVQALSTHRVKP